MTYIKPEAFVLWVFGASLGAATGGAQGLATGLAITTGISLFVTVVRVAREVWKKNKDLV